MRKQLNIDKILDVFSSLAGSDALPDASVFCLSAKDTIEKWLKEDCDIDNNMSLLCYAAACLAYYRWCIRASVDNMVSFTAGDIKISQDSQKVVSSAKSLLNDAMSNISFLTKDKKFAFRSI